MERYHQIIPEGSVAKLRDYLCEKFIKIIPPDEREVTEEDVADTPRTNLDVMMSWQRKKYENG